MHALEQIRAPQTERRQEQIAAHEMGKKFVTLSILLVFGTDFFMNNSLFPHLTLNL